MAGREPPPTSPSVGTLLRATWRELRRRPAQRLALVALVTMLDSALLLGPMSMLSGHEPVPFPRGLFAAVILIGVVSFVSTMHRALAEATPRRGSLGRWLAVARSAAVLAVADVVLWPASLGLGLAMALALGRPEMAVAAAPFTFGLVWWVTRVALGAPESCILDRGGGWVAAVRRSRAPGVAHWRLAVLHLPALGIGLAVALASPSRNLGDTVLSWLALQVAVSLDAAVSTAWYRELPRERLGEELVRVFE